MERFTNYYGRGFTNRASWLRQDVGFLEEQCKSPQARFVVFNDALNPLVKRESSNGPFDNVKDLVKHKVEGGLDIATVSWKDIASAFPSDKPLFAKDPSAHIADSPQLVFLGIDERSSSSKTDTSTSGKTAAQNTQQSLPTKSDKDTSFQPTGQPYFAIDTLKHPDIATRALEIAGGESNALYMDLRAELLCLDFESTGVISAGRALSDWNRRNRYCPACGNETGSIWGGWKRGCLPDQASRTPERPPCVSKKGVHNFAYPRTDPVVIMAVQSHDGSELLLGRNKSWPSGFYSCLAGFTEPGESVEESVRREVWEEAGVRVNDVQYHSSQPWPFPGSLMLGCIATAEPDTHIRLDLDNELESAAFYPFEAVAAALAASERTGISRHESQQMQKAQDEAELKKDKKVSDQVVETAQGKLRLPPKTAIAHTLVRAWVEARQAAASKDKVGQEGEAARL